MQAQSIRMNQPVVNLDKNERVISAIGGVVLVLYGLMRRSLGSISLALSGMYLLYRAFGGRCLIYQLLGINKAISGQWAKGGLREFSNQPPMSVSGDEVAESSWASFPTSDPPSWNMGQREGTRSAS